MLGEDAPTVIQAVVELMLDVLINLADTRVSRVRMASPSWHPRQFFRGAKTDRGKPHRKDVSMQGYFQGG
jgi:hypothetical protein